MRSEIEQKEYEREVEIEKLVKPKIKAKEQEKKEVEKKKEEEATFKTRLARNIVQNFEIMTSKKVRRNELFAPGRMAYVIELDDENDADIPTTLIRSKADVPTINDTPTLTTNDIVINKLAQILSYLRQGNRHGKKGRRLKDGKMRPEDFNDMELPPRSIQDDKIYEDVGDYVPDLAKRRDHGEKSKKKESYFDKPDTHIDIDAKANAPQLPSISGIMAGGEVLQLSYKYFSS